MQAKSVWSDTSIPIKLAKQFNLPFPEKGADGLFETVSGEHHAYQVKFRSDWPSLTWGELSTFVGITDHLVNRLLITNCNSIAKELYAARDSILSGAMTLTTPTSRLWRHSDGYFSAIER